MSYFYYFQVFPIVIFFSSVIAIMYYWGIMQMIVCRIAWLMQFTMGTTAIESLNAATNIFIGMVRHIGLNTNKYLAFFILSCLYTCPIHIF